MKRFFTAVILLLAAISFAAVMVEKDTKVLKKKIDLGNGREKVVNFTYTSSGTFDKSANGYGWYWSNSKRVQTNMDPVTGPMIGSIYRRLDPIGSGTLGGVIGTWGTGYEGNAASVFTVSPNQSDMTTTPGARFPQTTEFINGYLFGAFTDMDISPQYGYPMFIVCDATLGWDLAMWSEARLIAATDGGAYPLNAWTAKGDVAYNPEDGYYYWTTWWEVDGGSFGDSKLTMSMGRSETPSDPDSWVWTDYHDLYLDCSSGTGIDDLTGQAEIAYAKDIYGNGTGFGIVVAPFVDDTYIKTNIAGDMLDVSSQPRLGYLYTTNWGADWSTGDFKSNWKTPNDAGDNMFAADIDKLFDWYGSEVTGDSIGVDSLTNETIYEKYPLNWAYMTWNTHVICTEYNIVHAMIKVIPTSTEATEYWFFTNDEKTIAGYYDIVGEITESGVNWISANYIAAFMGINDDGETMEWPASNTHKFSNGYAGNGVVYASWLDRPESKYSTPSPEFFPSADTDYVDDAFFTYSPDHGRTWAIQKTVTMPNATNPGMPYELKYAYNVTKSGTVHDEGWTVANHGTNITTPGVADDGIMTVYAAYQNCDTANPIAPPIESFRDYQQFLKFQKITGTSTGIETEEVSLTKDFTLFQNYPNPFNPATEIRFALQNDAKVKLSVYNTKGELVSNLKNEKMLKGVHAVNFDASALNSGVYFYKLNVNGMSESKKMVLTK
jgi:hypothetical protein